MPFTQMHLLFSVFIEFLFWSIILSSHKSSPTPDWRYNFSFISLLFVYIILSCTYYLMLLEFSFHQVTGMNMSAFSFHQQYYLFYFAQAGEVDDTRLFASFSTTLRPVSGSGH